MEVKISGLDGVLDTLKKLPPELVSKRGGPVLASLRKGAGILVKQARENFKRVVDEPGKTGITQSTGFTEKQIVARRSRMPSSEKGERVVVTVKGVSHPTSRGEYRGRSIKANDIAFILEVGAENSGIAASPWLRPAYYAKRDEAVRVASADLVKRVDKIVKKLEAQNAGK